MDKAKPNKAQAGSGIPLVRLSLIKPFLDELDHRGVDADAVLINNGLVRTTVMDTSIFVPVIVIHRFLEDAAEATADPCLGMSVGESLDLRQWPPFVDAVTHSTTLVDFLVHFIRGASGEASSARHMLELDARHAFFREIRTSKQEIQPAQNDAFTVAYLLNLIKRAAGKYWRAADVMAKVCEPDAMRPNYLGVHIVGGDSMGAWIRFPVAWLTNKLDKALLSALPSQGERVQLPAEFIEALRSILALHLHSADLKVSQVAQMLGMSGQSLQRKLKASGTTLSAELKELRKQRAMEELAHTAKTIVDVAHSVGFSNPTSFTRAFKSWSGKSPRNYRKSHQSQ